VLSHAILVIGRCCSCLTHALQPLYSLQPRINEGAGRLWGQPDKRAWPAGLTGTGWLPVRPPRPQVPSKGPRTVQPAGSECAGLRAGAGRLPTNRQPAADARALAPAPAGGASAAAATDRTASAPAAPGAGAAPLRDLPQVALGQQGEPAPAGALGASLLAAPGGGAPPGAPAAGAGPGAAAAAPLAAGGAAGGQAVAGAAADDAGGTGGGGPAAQAAAQIALLQRSAAELAASLAALAPVAAAEADMRLQGRASAPAPA